MKDYIEITSRMFDNIATFSLTSRHNIDRPNFRLVSPILSKFNKNYSDGKGFKVEDYSIEENNAITFYNWNNELFDFDRLFSIPVTQYYFSPKKGCFAFTGNYNGEDYFCKMYLTDK